MRYLLRSSLSVLLAFCMVFSNSYYAIAGTTTEQSYDIMPLDIASSNFNLSTYVGTYNRASEVFTWDSADFSGLRNGVIVPPSDWYSGNSVSMNYNANMMFAFGLSIGTADRSSPISIPDGSTLSIYLPSIRGYGWDSAAQKNIYLSNNLAVPYRVYADMHFTATQVIGNTHSGTYHDQTIELTNFFTPSANNDGSLWFDLNLQIPVQADQSNVDESIDRLYNINLRYIKIYAVYDTSQFLYQSDNSKVNFVDGQNYNMIFGMRNVGSSNISSRIYVTYSGGNGNAELSSGLSGIQSSISSLSSSVSNQVQQVKTQLSQSTNTITTRIDTMSTNIQQGLQNVVQSAQQNTQNIINTVTTKVDEVKTGITQVKDSIVDLPNKLEEMLTGFFVPDEETINAKFAEFETLLSDRFGLIYQSADIIHDFADSFQTQAVMLADTGGIIQLPSVTVNLAGTDFSFGGYDVDIIPDGFEFLQTAVRLATSMICTVVFINMCKNKLEAILK